MNCWISVVKPLVSRDNCMFLAWQNFRLNYSFWSVMVKSSRCELPSATSGMWGVEGRDPLTQSWSTKGAGLENLDVL